MSWIRLCGVTSAVTPRGLKQNLGVWWWTPHFVVGRRRMSSKDRMSFLVSISNILSGLRQCGAEESTWHLKPYIPGFKARFKSRFYHFLVTWSQIKYLTHMDLSFSFCKMGIMILWIKVLWGLNEALSVPGISKFYVFYPFLVYLGVVSSFTSSVVRITVTVHIF